MHIIRTAALSIVAFLSSATIRADVISGIDTLRPWQGINFGTREIRAVEQRQECDSAIEFFYAADDGCCLMLSCHCGLRFGALHGLYLSSKPLDSVDLSYELVLGDTALFTRGDTLDSHYTCPASSNFFHGTGTQPLDWGPYENGFFVAMTADGNYVLLCVRWIPLMCYDLGEPCPGSPMHWVREDRIEAQWWLWTNGRPDFGDRVRVHSYRKVSAGAEPAVRGPVGVHAIDGRKLPGTVVRGSEAADVPRGVYLQPDAGRVRRMLRMW